MIHGSGAEAGQTHPIRIATGSESQLLIQDRKQENISTNPTTVYAFPFRLKPVPDVLTNPVSMGDGALDVGPELVVDGALVEDIAPGRHCE